MYIRGMKTEIKPSLLRIDPDVKAKGKDYATKRGWTFTLLVHKALQEYLNKRTPADINHN